ncbi:PH domain-containing protein [Spiractinospora alimapuensis]|uniref:PH domain-containing protein n=1 Tax=Spiractinospora alimapuensis TaxID=2820884 RepID=UPI001F18F60A|nr:PH domain-containing protein [Spiractinospora alimapuensis]QVQ53549.1 PH domain-containing protein [Spiractinospora alimapuensis]
MAEERDDGFSVARQEVPPGSLRLRPPRNEVHRRSVSHWTLRALVGSACFVGPPLVAAVIIQAFTDVSWLSLLLWGVTGVTALAAAVVTVVMPRWRFRVHRWEVTNDAVYTLSGWFWQEWRVAPLSRIQTVDTHRGPLQRPLGLSTVIVTTASAAGPLRIESLGADSAADVAAQLTAATQATPGDAT